MQTLRERARTFLLTRPQAHRRGLVLTYGLVVAFVANIVSLALAPAVAPLGFLGVLALIVGFFYLPALLQRYLLVPTTRLPLWWPGLAVAGCIVVRPEFADLYMMFALATILSAHLFRRLRWSSDPSVRTNKRGQL